MDHIKRFLSRIKVGKATTIRTTGSIDRSKTLSKEVVLVKRANSNMMLSELKKEPVLDKEPALIVENYSLNEPFAYAKIRRDQIRGNITYLVDEPKLESGDILKLNHLKEILNEVLDLKPSETTSKKAAGEYLVRKSEEILKNYGFKLDDATRKKVLYYVVRDNLGFGKIDPFMHDPMIEDVSCDGVNVPIYVWHRK
ncbi:hypothetical protein MUP79_00690 [Candidatus Bathyarchaeota archaeon]|nr:hypothetical protein [Candidatus Bathyarchaeota archaeon]